MEISRERLKTEAKLLRDDIFRIFDSLAGKWLQWHTNLIISENPNDSKLLYLDHRDGKLRAAIESSVAPQLGLGLAKLLMDVGAENYVTFTIAPRIDRGMRSIEVIVKWENGLSPQDKYNLLKMAVDRLTKKYPYLKLDLDLMEEEYHTSF